MSHAHDKIEALNKITLQVKRGVDSALAEFAYDFEGLDHILNDRELRKNYIVKELLNENEEVYAEIENLIRIILNEDAQ